MVEKRLPSSVEPQTLTMSF